MAGCLKVTDPRALTLAYKLPLKRQECEWVLLGGRTLWGKVVFLEKIERC